MPYTLKTNQISVKDPETGEYSGVDILAEQTEQGLIAELQAEGTTQVNRINQAAVDVQSAVDKAETDAAKIISDTQISVNTLEAQKNTIAQTIASMAELGTDTTLSTPGMAADAKATGDEISNVKNALAQETNVRTVADNALSARITDNNTDISALQISVTNLGTHKVAQPLDSNNQLTNGTSGQSLRTKGDGTTEWADVGLPTDAQTAQAVSDWLDNHPEATTTVIDGSLTLEKLANSLKGLVANTKNGLTNDKLDLIPTGSVGNVTLTENYKVYDFQGASVGTLTINCLGAIIKNFETSETVIIKSGARNNTFYNCRFTNKTQSVQFESSTWANMFCECLFIGDGAGSVCMNAELHTNDTLILSNCYFYNFEKIITCSTNTHITIKGGWCDSCTYVFYGSDALNGITVSISDFDAELVTAVFKCTAYTIATFIFGGSISPQSGCICDFSSGAVNLLLTSTISPNMKLFSGASPSIRYVNLPKFGEMCYPVTGVASEQTVRVYIPPNETIQPFGEKVHLLSVNSSNSNVEFRVNGGAYTKGTVFNGVVNLQIKNNASYYITEDVVIKSQNILV